MFNAPHGPTQPTHQFHLKSFSFSPLPSSTGLLSVSEGAILLPTTTPLYLWLPHLNASVPHFTWLIPVHLSDLNLNGGP